MSAPGAGPDDAAVPPPTVGPLRSAWSLLTVVGGDGGSAPHPAAASCYGVVGAVLGAAVALVWWALSPFVAPWVAAVVVVAVDAGLTGMLHLDGLADCADGLLAPMARARRLEVMRTPDVGAFAVVVLVLTLLLRVAALASVATDWPAPLLVVGLWAWSRGSMAAVVATTAYARSGPGLPTAVAARRANRLGALIGFGLGGAALAGAGRAGLAAASGAVVAALAVRWLARRRLGGYTGDVLGAVAVMAETVGLVCATVHR